METAVSILYFSKLRPLVREGALQRQDSNIQKINLQTGSNIWSQVPEWARYQDILTD
jgi:hypothetical protein